MEFLLEVREPVSVWTHAAGLALAVPGTVLLWNRAEGDRTRQFVLLVYGVCLACCYAFSALNHAVQGGSAAIARFALLDRIGIYGLIAGTYTPIVWIVLRGRWRRWTLVLVWLAAVLGSSLHLAFGVLPTWLGTGLYLAMGWGAAVLYLELARVLSHRSLVAVVFGGVLYSTGAVLNVLKWPNLVPGVFGSHELFHLFVMAGSLAHFLFIARLATPTDSVVRRPLPHVHIKVWKSIAKRRKVHSTSSARSGSRTDPDLF
ncbi:MAG: hemolysin III family protein [Isosphaeraceae bacterium]